mmetsp:Transcript_14956/g.23153  ORF Transcript_14956/g.23153 Transcript_14956/m.23153 type:complete len:129 (+) Transcript_14956:228-614(+)
MKQMGYMPKRMIEDEEEVVSEGEPRPLMKCYQQHEDDSSSNDSYAQVNCQFSKSQTGSPLDHITDLDFEKQPRRSIKVRDLSYSVKSGGNFIFSVYSGNFPNVVRDALTLRLDKDGLQIWAEVEPNTE